MAVAVRAKSHQRVVPDRDVGPYRFDRRLLFDRTFDVPREFVSSCHCAAQLAQFPNHFDGLEHRVGVAQVDGNASSLERFDVLPAVLFLVRDNEVGPGSDDAIDFGVLRAADCGHLPDLARGLGTEPGAADKTIARAEPKNEFCQAGYERNDAFGRHSQSLTRDSKRGFCFRRSPAGWRGTVEIAYAAGVPRVTSADCFLPPRKYSTVTVSPAPWRTSATVRSASEPISVSPSFTRTSPGWSPPAAAGPPALTVPTTMPFWSSGMLSSFAFAERSASNCPMPRKPRFTRPSALIAS